MAGRLRVFRTGRAERVQPHEAGAGDHRGFPPRPSRRPCNGHAAVVMARPHIGKFSQGGERSKADGGRGVMGRSEGGAGFVGGASGIGAACCRVLRERGATVVLSPALAPPPSPGFLARHTSAGRPVPDFAGWPREFFRSRNRRSSRRPSDVPESDLHTRGKRMTDASAGTAGRPDATRHERTRRRVEQVLDTPRVRRSGTVGGDHPDCENSPRGAQGCSAFRSLIADAAVDTATHPTHGRTGLGTLLPASGDSTAVGQPWIFAMR